MLELRNDLLIFSCPEVHPDAHLDISFMRTLRIPDDDKEYPLPPGLGAFPVRHVDDFKDRVPAKWTEHGGVMLPMYQSEALWLHFRPSHISSQAQYPFAIKIAAGKVSAVTGDDWTSGLRLKDYVVAPKQPWLDGYAVGNGVIRQFVAATMGSGFTAEEQITGKAEHGGIQIEVFPMKREVFDRRFPVRHRLSSPLRSRSWTSRSEQTYGSSVIASNICESSMGLAAGGRMKQQIFDDPYDFSDWDTAHSIRCFVHLADSMTWRAITQQDPPYPPQTAADYSRHGLPWFDYYQDSQSLQGTDKLKGVKSLATASKDKGVKVLPENETAHISTTQVHTVSDQKRPDEVRSGNW